MDGLPLLPGYRFDANITKQNYLKSAQFRWKNGYVLPKDKTIGIGKEPLDTDAIIYNKKSETVGYDPTMTYGKARDPPKPIFRPSFVELDRKCLTFHGYTVQKESSLYSHRVRRVKITYFLVDDTISITEPAIRNAGYAQGTLLKRGPIPNPHRNNRTWHWSDFNVGVELSFYGVTYRLCGCDAFTKHFFSTKGVKLGNEEPVPDDPYVLDRRQQQQRQPRETSDYGCDAIGIAKTNQFLQHDGKVLRFYAAWLDDTSEVSRWRYFVLYYFMSDGSVEIHDSKKMNGDADCGHNPNTTFLKKMKLPVGTTDLPSDFPYIYMEPGIKEYKKYYGPKDLIVGNSIRVMGRTFLLYDCDIFTRNYFQQNWKIVQPEPVKIDDPNKTVSNSIGRIIPPHNGFGDPDDTLQYCISLDPKPPKTVDFVTYVLNAHKKLRFKLKLLPVHEEDKIRNFIMEFCLGNDHITITELAGKNTGFLRGRFMGSCRLRKPNTILEENIFYGPKDFILGNKLQVYGSVFEIVELDLWTYKYMNRHKDMFTQEAIDKAKSFLENKGLLNPEQKDVLQDNLKKQEISSSSDSLSSE